MFPPDAKFIRLSPNHEIKTFQSKDEKEDLDLKEFLEIDSFNYMRQLLAVTYLIEDKNSTIAYFSVSNDKISLNETDSKNFWKTKVSKSLHFEKRGLSNFPAVKIGRLAVNSAFHGLGIGRSIIDWVKQSFTANNKTGCLFIVVDALNRDSTIKFYEKCNFSFLTQKDKNDKTRLMFYCLLENIN